MCLWIFPRKHWTSLHYQNLCYKYHEKSITLSTRCFYFIFRKSFFPPQNTSKPLHQPATRQSFRHVRPSPWEGTIPCPTIGHFRRTTFPRVVDSRLSLIASLNDFWCVQPLIRLCVQCGIMALVRYFSAMYSYRYPSIYVCVCVYSSHK